MSYRYFLVPLTEEEALAHYGTKDKHWGIRRETVSEGDTLSHKKTKKDRSIQDIMDGATTEQKETIDLIVGAALDDVDISGDEELVGQYDSLSKEHKLIIDFVVGNLLQSDSAFKHSDSSEDDSLSHFGVKGMRWGVRRVDTPTLSSTTSAVARSKARAKVKSGGATLGEAHRAALKSTGHRAINAFTGDKTFWKRMGITAGISAGVAGLALAGPFALPAGVLTSLGSAVVGSSGVAGYAVVGGNLVSLANIGAGTIMAVGMQAAGAAAVAGTAVNVVGNTARAVGGNMRINRSYANLGKAMQYRQTQGNKRVAKILNKSGSLSKNDLKHGAVDELLSLHGSTLMKYVH